MHVGGIALVPVGDDYRKVKELLMLGVIPHQMTQYLFDLVSVDLVVLLNWNPRMERVAVFLRLMSGVWHVIRAKTKKDYIAYIFLFYCIFLFFYFLFRVKREKFRNNRVINRENRHRGTLHLE